MKKIIILFLLTMFAFSFENPNGKVGLLSLKISNNERYEAKLPISKYITITASQMTTYTFDNNGYGDYSIISFHETGEGGFDQFREVCDGNLTTDCAYGFPKSYGSIDGWENLRADIEDLNYSITERRIDNFTIEIHLPLFKLWEN